MFSQKLQTLNLLLLFLLLRATVALNLLMGQIPFTSGPPLFFHILTAPRPTPLPSLLNPCNSLPTQLALFAFFIWLQWVLVVAHGISIVSCGIFCWCTWTLSLGLVALRHVGSQFLQPGIKHEPPALQGKFLTTGQSGKSHDQLLITCSPLANDRLQERRNSIGLAPLL